MIEKVDLLLCSLGVSTSSFKVSTISKDIHKLYNANVKTWINSETDRTAITRLWELVNLRNKYNRDVLSLEFLLLDPKSCDPNDLLALKEFSGNLTNGSIISVWSTNSVCCKWDGVSCNNLNLDSIYMKLEVLDLSYYMLSGSVSQVLNAIVSMVSSIQKSATPSDSSGGLMAKGLTNCSTTLQQLHVDSNLLSGHLPDIIFDVIFGVAIYFFQQLLWAVEQETK
ncbi:hypothetical protein IFM89_004951 [Coptis chinensis]|uniref:Leucine-rich repeat-containing N-terminal plant-type domain-containing protein n=1 Tax=Coptis chinensis TaxID=261450 RepID=A0A835HR22_9MAGN|nr:hypothetical protein IFM89_004951 [Coptis chinensis]